MNCCKLAAQLGPLSGLLLTVLALAFSASGCGRRGTLAPKASGLAIQVMIQGEPISNIQVELKRSHGGPTVLMGISDTKGIAELYIPIGSNFGFSELDVGDLELLPSLTSLGDGGWILKKRYADTDTNGLGVRFSATKLSDVIDLPKDAIDTL